MSFLYKNIIFISNFKTFSYFFLYFLQLYVFLIFLKKNAAHITFKKNNYRLLSLDKTILSKHALHKQERY